MDDLDIPQKLKKTVNEKVLSFIKDLSAHSDIASVLIESVKSLGDVQIFCPNYSRYKYICVFTEGIIFGVAYGMHDIAFRLSEQMKTRALMTGGIKNVKCGDEWILVVHQVSDSDWPKVDVKFWALKSYEYARELAKKSVSENENGPGHSEGTGQ